MDASCSSSAFQKFSQNNTPPLGASQERITSFSSARSDPSQAFRSAPSQEIRAPEWDIFLQSKFQTQDTFCSPFNATIDLPITRDITPGPRTAKTDGVLTQWTSEYMKLGGHSQLHGGLHGGATNFKTYASVTTAPSAPVWPLEVRPSLIAPTAAAFSRPDSVRAAEAEFDLEMSHWIDGHGALSHDIERDSGHEEVVSAPTQDPLYPRRDRDTPVSRNEQEPRADATGLSKAARELLEAVGHENGEKWQNSEFLSLMKAFRDGSKDIVGGDIKSRDV